MGGLRRPWSRRSQVLGIPNKQLDGDTQIANNKVLVEVKAESTLQEGRGLEQPKCFIQVVIYTSKDRERIWAVLRSGFC
jgi:hypothetical protein